MPIANTVEDYSIRTSSYLIDLSKKCIIPKAGKDKNGIPWTLYGDINKDTLKNFGYNFKEDFVQGNKVAEKDFNKIMSPITKLLGSIASSMPIFKGTNLGEFKDVRSTAIFLYGLVDTFLNTKKEGEDAQTTLAKEIFEKFEYTNYYNLPLRKNAPTLDINSTSKIVIEFAYGKCNMFDAYKEVFEPLMKISEEIFPTLTTPDAEGLSKMTGANPVPYEQQTFVNVIKNILGVGDTTAMNIGSFAVGKVTKAHTAYQTVKTLKDTATSLSEDPANSIKISGISSSVKINGFFGVNDNIWNNTIRKNVNNAVKDGLESIDLDEESDGLLPKKDGKENNYDDESKAKDIIKEKLSEFATVASQKASSEGKILAIPERAIKPKKVGEDWQMEIRERNDKEQAEVDNIKNIIAGIINFEPRVVGKTLKEMTEPIIREYSQSIEIGFPPVYVTNLADVGDKLVTGSDTVKPKITLSKLLFTKASISFDFSNTDEAGWPMAGTLTIDGLTPLVYPRDTLSFDTTTENDKKYSKEILKYEKDEDEN